MDLGEAARFLSLPADAVEAMAAARYLPLTGELGSEPSFAVSDLKGFLARNSEGGANEFFLGPPEAVDPQVLIEALDRRSEDMARRALEIFEQAFPEAEKWSERERDRFIDQSRNRFEAILAVTTEGAAVDEALVEDLEAVGASAAWSGSPLPQLLVVLRISRDLVVQTAVEVAEECGRHWALALSLLLNRILPAMDRLTDALAQGYWAAVVGREEESRARYEHLVERSSDGIYEADLESRILYANPSLATMLGRSVDDLQSVKLGDAFTVVGAKEVLDELVVEVEGDVSELTFEVLRADGVRRQVQVVTFPRHHKGLVAGFQGVVRDVTAGLELERAKNEFLALITQDLRSPITTILGLSVTLEAYADKLSRERLRRMGASVRRQAERISRLADDLHDVSRLESQSLRLTLRPVRLANTVEAALASLDDT
ncbi:MAG: PAS domain S-box protein, partial [Acidimicrobiia bacterium]